jgi:sortase A
VVGELLLTAGVVLCLFVVYALFGTGVATSQAQDALDRELEALDRLEVGGDTTAEGAAEAQAGAAYARMRIPRLGEGWEWVVVQGVEVADLQRGPGHYLASADPGEIGNFAVAGHRATYGEPFAHLDRVRVGDAILVDYQGAEYRYLVTESFLTTPGNGDVVAPVPGDPTARPTEALITLTTCHPRFSGRERLIIHGVLEGQVD